MSRRPLFLLLGVVAVLATAPCGLAAESLRSTQKLIKEHCAECHDADSKKGGLDLTALAWKPEQRANFDRWVSIFDKVTAGEMPPAKKARPPQALQTAALRELKTSLVTFNKSVQLTRGRVVLRRLNRVEYENTLHDLLGIDEPLAGILPEDAATDGFDTVAEGLRLSTLHMEKYLEAADLALDAALKLTPEPEMIKQRYAYREQTGVRKNIDEAGGKNKGMCRDLPDGAVIFNDASYITKITGFYPRHTGLYRIRASGYAFQSSKPVILRIHAGSYRNGTLRMLGWWDMAPGPKAQEVETVARIEQGEYLYPAPDDLETAADGKNVNQVGAADYQGSGLALQWIEFEGPLHESWPPPSVGRLFGDLPVVQTAEAKRKKYVDRNSKSYEIITTNPKADARRLLSAFAMRAFRRPLEDGEVDGFVKLVADSLEAGGTFEESMRVGFRAVLTAPQFLLFEERPGRLGDYALASRLSYFLWSTLPDDELLSLASKGALSKPATLRAQVERMLASPRATAFVKDFAGQWLDLRNIDATSPDRRLYPEFDELLKVSMVRETEEFFSALLRENLGVANFVDSRFSILNRRLASHYGIEGVEGEEFRKVSLPAGSHRGGVLTQAAVLKVTANGTVTSPVLRGAWVMKHLLGQPPPPPPANVGAIEPDTRGATTIREQLAKHRNAESCAGCHSKIDPPGFALENYDVIGGWRERYRSVGKGDRPTAKFHGRGIYEYKIGPAVDASGELADGRKFANMDEFKAMLLAQKDQIARAFTSRLLTYATGAGIEFADRDVVESVLQRAKSQDYGLRTLVQEVVQTPVFQNK